MANQEGIDIIIRAEDQYTATMNKIDASTKIFGKTAENTQKQISALEKYMITLVANGLDPADKKIVQLKADYDKLSQSLNNGNGSLKDANKKWSSLALVVQDLPYGFRGIQNNLPALFGSLASGAGAAYFAFSAVVAVITAMDMGLFKTKKATDLLTEANKEYADSIKSAMGSAGEEITKIETLTKIASDNSVSMDKRLQAVKSLQEEYPSYFGNLSQEAILNGNVKTQVNDVKTAIIERAKATAVAGKINNLSAQKFAKEEELYQLALQKTFKIQKAIKYVNQMKELGYTESAKHLKGLIDTQISGIREEENVIKGTVDLIDKELTRLGNIYEGSTKKSMGLDIEAPKATKSTYLKDFAAALKEEERLFKDNLNNQLAFAEGNDIKKVEILGKAMSDLISWYNQGIIEESFYQNTLADLYKQTYNLKIGLLKSEQTEKDKIAKQNEQINNRELQNSLDSLKIQSDVATKIANSSGKATSSERIAILEEYKNALYQLASVGGYTAEQFDKIDDALQRVDGAIKGSKDNLKDYEVSWTDTLNVINKAILDFVINSIVSLSENLGQLLAGEKVQPFVALSELLANALSDIGKALITLAITQKLALLSLSNPLSWPIALAAGIAAVAAGAALKSSLNAKSDGGGSVQKFANGGIISGPTMGLMGEYPGASSNPEVVAPLDKLKDMIGGGGGGTFVLRGQDLLLSVNRAQKASNIKGQNINLA